jgi:hypothetical protein
MEHAANVGWANDVLGYKGVEQLGQDRDAHNPKLGGEAVLVHGLPSFVASVCGEAAAKRLWEDRGNMKLVDLPEWQKAFRERLAAEIVRADKKPEADREIEKLLESLGEALARAPLAEDEKLLALYIKLVEGLTSIERERERKQLADQFAKFLRLEVVEAAVQAFREIKRPQEN